MHLSPSQKLIIDLLSDFKVHCTAHEMYQKDDRTRISELRRKGFVFNENVGNCKDLTHHHGADLKLRQLISCPQETPKLLRMTNKIKEWNQQFATVEPININQPLW